MRRLLSSLCVLGLFFQAVLPAAHEWQTARAEAAYHLGDEGPAAAEHLSSSHDREHHHHDAGSCELCPAFSAVRVPAQSLSSCLPFRPGGSVLVQGDSAGETCLLASSSPRGPPAA